MSEDFTGMMGALAIAAGFTAAFLLFLWVLWKSGRISVRTRHRIQLALILLWSAGGSSLMGLLALKFGLEGGPRHWAPPAILAVLIVYQGLWHLKKHRGAASRSTTPSSTGTPA